MFRILLIVGIVVATVTTSLIVLNLSNQDKKDILKTGDPTKDAFDNVILEESSRAGWPDPMLIKAQISQESDFNQFENTLGTRWSSPCGLKEGWTEIDPQMLGYTDGNNNWSNRFPSTQYLRWLERSTLSFVIIG